ncbi:MAG: hypothetical protein GEU28_08285 [Dehalococcoidia bacterium]|nr:hypothetical protein [Dehalococcoidia bacterium]
MANVFIRNLEPGAIENLKARARRHGRSLQAELKRILEDAADTPFDASDPDWRVEWARKMQAETAGRVHTDTVELLREDRRD